MMWTLLTKYSEAWTAGIVTTLRLAGGSMAIGIPIGIMLGLVAHRFNQTLGAIVSFAAFLISGTPILVILLWLHFPLQTLLNINVAPFWTALLTITCVLAASVSETTRYTIRTFPTGLVLAARTCGLTRMETALKITLPIALRQMLPGLLAVAVATVHGTLFASLISVDEALRTAQRINAVEYKPIEIYTGLGVLFWIVCLPLHAAAKFFAQRSAAILSTH